MPEKTKNKNYEKMGRLLAELYDSVHPNRGLLYRTAFLKGMVTGFGSVLGATIGVAILIWLLTLFEEIPLLGPMFENLQRTIQSK